MNLSQMKEIEDLKAQLSASRDEYSKIYQPKKQKAYNEVVNGFKTYFKNQGFEIQETSSFVYAIYRDIKFSLSLPGTDTSFVGAASVFNLSEEHNKIDKHSIMIIQKGHRTGIHITSSISPKTEDEKYKQEVESLKNSIEDSKKNIEAMKDDVLVFGLRIDNNRSGREYEQFNSMNDLIEHLFESK